VSDLKVPETLIALERAAWEEQQAGRLTVAASNAVQDAITAHAEATGLDRYTVEMGLKRVVRHVEG
jgi:hypothetical protein